MKNDRLQLGVAVPRLGEPLFYAAQVERTFFKLCVCQSVRALAGGSRERLLMPPHPRACLFSPNDARLRGNARVETFPGAAS
jgi:hypothetical protein